MDVTDLEIKRRYRSVREPDRLVEVTRIWDKGAGTEDVGVAYDIVSDRKGAYRPGSYFSVLRIGLFLELYRPA
jgi:hypothetical protein